ncbi:transposon ty2-dr1 Gag-Pol polyprotein [Plakobranchus ocellatus]|uniref:Transposon ty2-dr1 Gag-Pol polyprotein n=1 Tax=Plakobranchus ocellatus TaxID=259542 RepID=A0AAV3XSM5_9GAST|nr:transposon ty2-dr1 Gag-Pol polyprotein [Plakobranchus ocellatus]
MSSSMGDGLRQMNSSVRAEWIRMNSSTNAGWIQRSSSMVLDRHVNTEETKEILSGCFVDIGKILRVCRVDAKEIFMGYGRIPRSSIMGYERILWSSSISAGWIRKAPQSVTGGHGELLDGCWVDTVMDMKELLYGCWMDTEELFNELPMATRSTSLIAV